MKRKGLLALLGSICLVLILSTPAPAQVIKLTLAYQNPETGCGAVQALKPWVKRLEDATKGRVKVDVFYSQTLAKGPDTWNAVKSGVADMGWNFHGYWPEMTPLGDVITLPFLPVRTGEKASEVLWRLYERFPAMQQQFKDVHVLQLWTSDPFFLITSKKQVKTLEDLKGLKIRVAGGPPTEQMKALGAVPVLFPMPDAYLSIQKGVVDGMAAHWEPIHAFRLYEVVRHYTIVPLYTIYFSMGMNKQKWESLPKDIQQAITSVSGVEGAKFWGRNFSDTAEEGVIERTKAGAYQIAKYVLPPEELEKWRKVAGEPLWREWVKRMEAKGHPDAQKILNASLELLKQ